MNVSLLERFKKSSPEGREDMPTISSLFTIEEVLQHNTVNDYWIAIDGMVYDVSSYVDDHPGTFDVLLVPTDNILVSSESRHLSRRQAEIHGSDDFVEGKDAEFCKSLRELFKDYCIGELDSCPPVIPEHEIVSEKVATGNVQKLMTEKDAREEIEDAKHSKCATELEKDYCTGELDSCSPVIPEHEKVSKRGVMNNVQRSLKQYWALQVALVSISVVVGFLFLQKK